MWSTGAAFIIYLLLGIVCDVKQVSTQPRFIQRNTEQTPNEDTTLQEDIKKLINQINSMSEERDGTRSYSASPTEEDINLDSYYNILSNMYGVLQPLLRDRYIEDLPKTIVCILSGVEDCGLQAELTKTVSMELGRPLLALVSSLRSQTCGPQDSDRGPRSFFRTYFRMGDSSSAGLDSFQETLLNILSKLSFSMNTLNAVSGFMDAAMIYIAEIIATLFQIPLDYIKIALQFGIAVPSLNGKETCQQGDLKQLIMWGVNNNISWSFGNSIVDVLLEIFLAPEQPPCTYPDLECENPSSVPFQRSASEAGDSTDYNHNILLRCDRRNLAPFNDTLCADILTRSRTGDSTSVLVLCRALSPLTPNQIEQMWSNGCYVIQALMSPLYSRSSECTGPPPGVTPFSETPPLPQPAPLRVAREASNLQQLVCNYKAWSDSEVVDPVLVSFCSDNERGEFVKRVCNNATLMRKLLSDPMNSWLYGYCANFSADQGPLISELCVYEQWLDPLSDPVSRPLLEFCMNLDGPRLTQLICEHTGFFMLLFSNPQNLQFMPNCTSLPPPPPFPIPNQLELDSCRYSEWDDVMLIPIDLLSHCIRLDNIGFTQEVCLNQTFLNSMLQNPANTWLENHCITSLSLVTPEPTQSFSIAAWCDYHTWGERKVDVSVVGLCWQHDQLAFQKNVCCKPAVFEKLLEDPQNKWLTSVCTDVKEVEVIPQVCKYTDWTRPIIVDMTVVALCAEQDALNFTSKVCTNSTVLQNLLANQDNTWLIQHCVNHSDPTVNPGGEGEHEGDPPGFDPEEQCQYSSWSISLPGVVLLTLCWEHDQVNFVSSVCPNAGLLFLLSQEPASAWVGTMCNTYTNYTNNPTINPTTTTDTSTTAEPNVCFARNLVRRFNWTCSADLSSACQPGADQTIGLQMVVRCWVEGMRSRVEKLLTPPVASVLEQAVSTTVVVLLAVEEVQNISLHVTENIRLSVLRSVVQYLDTEENFEKKRVLLQCFGRVLTSLMQTARDVTNDEFFIKEYFHIPLSHLRPVLSEAHITTVRMILQYYSINKDYLQLSDVYLSTMVSVLFQEQFVSDASLFPELAPLLAAATPADILALPPLQDNDKVRETINKNLWHMSLDQRRAFGLWYSRVLPPSNIIKGQQSLIRDTGNLIAYLPFNNFQHLSPAQLLDGLDVLQRNTLSSLKQEFIAHSVTNTYRNLTAQDFIRLGNLSCLAEPENLLVYAGTEVFDVIRNVVMNCTRHGLSLPSILISDLLLDSNEFKVPSSISSDRLAELAHLLPALGAPFLQNLTQPQLVAALPSLDTVSFSPAQAAIILEKVPPSYTLENEGQLQQLGLLIVGIKTESLLNLTSDTLLSSLPQMAQHTPGLSPTQANAVSTKLWGFSEVVDWLDAVQPLLYSTPLLSVLPRTPSLVKKVFSVSKEAWNTQQAQAIFRELLYTKPDFVQLDFTSLGTLGQGVSCRVLQEQLQNDPSPYPVRRILALLRQQPGPLHTSLKKCLLEELYKFEFFSDLLKDLGAEIALSIPVSTIKKFSKETTDTLREMIVLDSVQFLKLSGTEKELLVDKMAQRLGMYTGVYTEEEFLSLGVMATFVADEILIRLDGSFFIHNLDYLRGLCYSSSKMDIVARILVDPDVFGPTKNWNQTTLSQVDRLLFFLPEDKLKEIPPDYMTVGRIEKLFMSQRWWEHGDVGTYCSDDDARLKVFQRQQFVLQLFLGFLKMNLLSTTPMVPTCEILHTTTPAAWPADSLTSMTPSAFSNCLELMGREQYFTSNQRKQLLQKVKDIYKPVSSFSQSVISQLGGLAVELSLKELSSLRLTERRSIAAMGAVSNWNSSQLAALFTTVLNSTEQSPSQLDSSILVAMGHIVCGAKPEDITIFNAVEFSKAALWLGQLRLSCIDEQLQAFVRLLEHSLAFGLISSWGTDVFIEIGVLAAGFEDMTLSSLVKEQIEGITPAAISKIPPERFRAAFDPRQISMFSYEQAVAVTDEQNKVLRPVQRQALNMVLTPWEDRPADFRGRSLALALSPSVLCLILGLLMLLILVPCPDLLCPGT